MSSAHLPLAMVLISSPVKRQRALLIAAPQPAPLEVGERARRGGAYGGRVEVLHEGQAHRVVHLPERRHDGLRAGAEERRGETDQLGARQDGCAGSPAGGEHGHPEATERAELDVSERDLARRAPIAADQEA